jgi:hypothetical protein
LPPIATEFVRRDARRRCGRTADVPPVDGVILGAGKQRLDVSVDVKAVG